MDYDKIFEQDIDRNFFYTNYPGKKLMAGKISLENAKARLSKNEYYAFVTYTENEILPQQYLPLSNLASDDGTLFATINRDVRYISHLCNNGGIQMISRLPDIEPGNPRYLLGPGPDKISLKDIILKEYEEYQKSKENSSLKAR